MSSGGVPILENISFIVKGAEGLFRLLLSVDLMLVTAETHHAVLIFLSVE